MIKLLQKKLNIEIKIDHPSIYISKALFSGKILTRAPHAGANARLQFLLEKGA